MFVQNIEGFYSKTIAAAALIIHRWIDDKNKQTGIFFTFPPAIHI